MFHWIAYGNGRTLGVVMFAVLTVLLFTVAWWEP